MAERKDLVVFSHLRWNFVWQRPQQIMSRLANSYRILFIEEPLPLESAGKPRWEFERPLPHLTVCVPRTASSRAGFHSDHFGDFAYLLPELQELEGLRDPILWFYTPMAFALIDLMPQRMVIYDCMDELSAFLNAPPELQENERSLLGAADLVFTGGRSIFSAKRELNSNCYCFPSSVDLAHFQKARNLGPRSARPRPRLGFFGVIDERMDLELLQFCSDAQPDWDWEFVGPVVKIQPETLPLAPNLLYRGQQPYSDLPTYVAAWDVCLIPFALNAATRYLSPTKTLEYMAAAKPIVSTAIRDIVDDYRDIVAIADDPQQFVAHCEQALQSSEETRTRMIQKMDQVLSQTSWDRTVSAMQALMLETESGRRRRRMPPRAGSAGPNGDPSSTLREETAYLAETRSRIAGLGSSCPPAESKYFPQVVIGAGPTGLSCAYHLGSDSLLIEKEYQVGGWCRSINVNGFTFDFAGHIMFSNDAEVHELYDLLLGSNVHWQEREAWIYSHETYTRYPFQGSLYGLPADVISECLVGAIEARFGVIDEPESGGQIAGSSNGQPTAALKAAPAANGESTKSRAHSHQDCCGDGVLEFTTRLGPSRAQVRAPHQSTENFHDFIYRVWGAGIARHFAIPYNQKLWAVPLHEMETSWLGGRVPMPDLKEMIAGALTPTPKPLGPNARFGYPLQGGFQALMDGFLPLLEGDLLNGVSVVRIAPAAHLLELSNGQTIYYDQLVSTMPLPTLIRICGDAVPEIIRRAAANLRAISVRCVHLGIGRSALTEKHWIYYPGDTIFHRVFVQGNASPHCNPPGGFGLTCEITYHPDYKPLPVEGEDLIEMCIRDCQRVGLFRPKDPIWARAQVDMPYAYVVYDHERKRNVNVIREWLSQFDIHLAGRYSEWEYYNSDHAFLSGKKAAKAVLARQAPSSRNQSSRLPADLTQSPWLTPAASPNKS